MKSMLRKGISVCFLTLVMVATAQAGWVCSVHNARGQVWYGYGYSRADAGSHAMRHCIRGSYYARNCVINYCSRR